MIQERLYGKDAREKIREGVQHVVNAVKVTLGPRGRNVWIHQDGSQPHNTKDGVTVANAVKERLSILSTGIEAIKQAANRANESAGDGTTTATVLAGKAIELGLDAANKGEHLVALSRGIQKAANRCVEIIQSLSKDVSDKETLTHIANISSNGDSEISQMVSDAVWNAGKDGYISVENSPTMKTYIEEVKGMQVGRGMIHPYFANTPKGDCVLTEPRVFLFGGSIKEVGTHKGHFAKLLGELIQTKTPTLFVVDKPENEFLMTLVYNARHTGWPVCVIEAPAHADIRKEVMRDIATYTGANYRSPEQGDTVDSFTMQDLGTAIRITVNKDKCVIEGDDSKYLSSVEERKVNIEMQIDDEQDEDLKNLYRQRISRLAGKVTKIYVGGLTEIEQKEKKDRTVDAVSAAKAAMLQGYVDGGGYALLKCQELIDVSDLSGSELEGAKVFIEALSEPNRCILSNAGLEYTADTANTINAFTGDICDLFEAGIIDPSKVTQTAIEAAASVASTVLTTDCIIFEKGYATS